MLMHTTENGVIATKASNCPTLEASLKIWNFCWIELHINGSKEFAIQNESAASHYANPSVSFTGDEKITTARRALARTEVVLSAERHLRNAASGEPEMREHRMCRAGDRVLVDANPRRQKARVEVMSGCGILIATRQDHRHELWTIMCLAQGVGVERHRLELFARESAAQVH